MTEIADDRSWWADVEHLRPGGEGPRPAASTATTTHSRATATAVVERPDRADREDRKDRAAGEDHAAAREDRAVRDERSAARDDRPSREDHRDEEPAAPRRLRITGHPADDAPKARPRRSDVAAFAEALDLDGAFGAPVPSPRSREIILTGSPSSRGDERAADRRTVRIRGTASLHELADSRPLREVGERRPRGSVERAVGRPDRIAMYVVLLGAFLVFLAVAGQSAGS